MKKIIRNPNRSPHSVSSCSIVLIRWTTQGKTLDNVQNMRDVVFIFKYVVRSFVA